MRWILQLQKRENLLSVSVFLWASQVMLVVKNLLANAWFQTLGEEGLLEERMATHSSILAYRSPWTEETGGLQSIAFAKNQTRLKRLSTYCLALDRLEDACPP